MKFYIAKEDVDTGPCSKHSRHNVIDRKDGIPPTDSVSIDGELP